MSNQPKPIRYRAEFSIVTITLTCSCGGACVNDNGSFILAPGMDKFGKCEACGKMVRIPKGAFK